MKKSKITSTRGATIAIVCGLVACLSIVTTLIVTDSRKPVISFTQVLIGFDKKINNISIKNRGKVEEINKRGYEIVSEYIALGKNAMRTGYLKLKYKYNSGCELSFDEMLEALALLLLLDPDGSLLL